MLKQGGDDLEDDFVLDETVALSGDEGADEVVHLDDEDVFLAAGDEDGPDAEDEDDAEDGNDAENPVANTSDAAASKKRKRRAKEKEKKAKVRMPHPSIRRPPSHC